MSEKSLAIDFYFDFLSPFAYLARYKLAQIADEHSCTINYKAIDLDQAKKAIGNTGPSNRDMPIKLGYLIKDLARWAERYGVPLLPVKNHNSRLLNLGTYYAELHGKSRDYVEAAYRRTWGEGGAPDDEALLRGIASELAWDPEEFLRYVNSAEAAERYQATTREAIGRGVFGVPTFMVGEQMWWGNDRLLFLEEYLAEQCIPQ